MACSVPLIWYVVAVAVHRRRLPPPTVHFQYVFLPPLIINGFRFIVNLYPLCSSIAFPNREITYSGMTDSSTSEMENKNTLSLKSIPNKMTIKVSFRLLTYTHTHNTQNR